MIEIITIEEAKAKIRQYTRFAYSNLVDPDKAIRTLPKSRQISIGKERRA